LSPIIEKMAQINYREGARLPTVAITEQTKQDQA
jgi:hypothetical protein